MDKNTFKQEIKDYTARGGKFAFVFGDIRLPVIYHEALNMLAVKMPAHEVFVPVDYSSGKAFINGCSQGLSSASLFRATRIAFYFHSTGRSRKLKVMSLLPHVDE